LKNHPPRDKAIPGPGAYQEGPKLGEKAHKITMQGRTKNYRKSIIYSFKTFALTFIVTLTTQRLVPGPGAYEPRTSINRDGKFILSKMKSTLSPSFSLPKLGIKGKGGTVSSPSNRNLPGPGAYTPKLMIGEKTMTSVYRQPSTLSFYHHDRFSTRSFFNSKTFNSPLDLPGPGAYQAPSEFGHLAPVLKKVRS